MEYINSKNIFLVMKETLRLKDTSIVDHGYRTAYIVNQMLKCSGKYEPFEMADISIYATFHDIGAYITETPGTTLTYDVRDFVPHSVLGFLICKYLSPHEEMAHAILHHHTDYSRCRDMTDQQKELASVFNIAEKADIFLGFLGDKFNSSIFDKYAGERLWDEGIKLLHQAETKYDIVQRIRDGSYLEDMEASLDYMIFSREEDKKYLESEMYFLGMRSQRLVGETASCISICDCLADRLLLSSEEKRILYYAALLRDVGMMAIPREIVMPAAPLTGKQKKLLETHVSRTLETLNGKIAPEVMEVIAAHHERGDGSGYPNRLKDNQMNRMQRILQLADTYATIVNDYRRGIVKDDREVRGMLMEEQRKGRFSKQLMDTLLSDYDEIQKEVYRNSQEVLGMYRKLIRDYKKLGNHLGIEHPGKRRT